MIWANKTMQSVTTKYVWPQCVCVTAMSVWPQCVCDRYKCVIAVCVVTMSCDRNVCVTAKCVWPQCVCDRNMCVCVTAMCVIENAMCVTVLYDRNVHQGMAAWSMTGGRAPKHGSVGLSHAYFISLEFPGDWHIGKVLCDPVYGGGGSTNELCLATLKGGKFLSKSNTSFTPNTLTYITVS